MKVYLVTTGEYSDYTVEGAYSTKEKAEEAIKMFGYTHAIIETFPLDKGLDRVARGWSKYHIILDWATHDVIDAKPYLTSPDDNTHWVVPYRSLTSIVWAKSKHHAIKITSDYLARNKVKWEREHEQKVTTLL